MRPNVVLRYPRGVHRSGASQRVHVAPLLLALTATLLGTACGGSRSVDPTEIPPRPLPVGAMVGVDVGRAAVESSRPRQGDGDDPVGFRRCGRPE